MLGPRHLSGEIERITEEGFDYEISLSTPSPPCTGHIEGQATWVDGNSAVDRIDLNVTRVNEFSPAETCVMEFVFDQNQTIHISKRFFPVATKVATGVISSAKLLCQKMYLHGRSRNSSIQ